MKKTRMLVASAFICVVFTLLPIIAFAHPGRTDSNGGHTDHSTGEYHYHHGYEAHDHYDMDGDGDKDCPFNFKNNTNNSTSTNTGAKISGSKTTGSTNTSSGSGSNSNSSTKTSDSNSSKTTEKDTGERDLILSAAGIYLFISFLKIDWSSELKKDSSNSNASNEKPPRKKIHLTDEHWTIITIIFAATAAILISILLLHPEYNILRFFK